MALIQLPGPEGVALQTDGDKTLKMLFVDTEEVFTHSLQDLNAPRVPVLTGHLETAGRSWLTRPGRGQPGRLHF